MQSFQGIAVPPYCRRVRRSAALAFCCSALSPYCCCTPQHTSSWPSLDAVQHEGQDLRVLASSASLLHKVHHASRGRARARPAAPRQAARRPRGPVMTKAPPSIGLSPPFSCAVVPWHCRPAVLPQSTPFCGIGVLPFCRTCKYCRIAAAVPGRIARASRADGPPTRRTAAGGARESHDEATTHSRGDQPPIQHQAQLPPR